MSEELKDILESYLISAPGCGWVKSSDLAERFDLRSDRVLRKVGNRPGLCSDFAISSDKGFKHISRATTGEWLSFKHRMRRHAISELARSSQLDHRRSHALKTIRHPSFTFQRDTGQGVLL